MSVENKNIIDIVSIDEEDNAVLTITDHLEWDIENEHLLILQDKINSYLGAIEGGELYTNYPNAENKNIIIRVVALHNPNEEGEIFLERVKKVIEEGGYSFQFKQRPLED
ncbi:MAG: DUF6572 domain-containing protein [Chitinophagaceae bacterium]